MAERNTISPTPTSNDAPPRDHLRCVVVTPEATIFDEIATFVALPLFDGEIGIAPLHSPMIGRLGYGEMRVVCAGVSHRYYVDGGFVQVHTNTVTVLTNRAILAADLDAQVAAEHLARALAKSANSDELIAIRDRHLAQARAQLRIARNAST